MRHLDRGELTLRQALGQLLRHPDEYLVRRWNWKAAVFSALWRGGIFFVANLTSGTAAAAGAMLAEASYRVLTAGFYGAVTQQLSRVRPVWCSSVSALVILPALAHTIEFVIHTIRHTPNLGRSMTASIAFTVVATLFNLHAMSRGVLTVGPGSGSVWSDMRALPGTLWSFLTSAAAALPARLCRLHPFGDSER